MDKTLEVLLSSKSVEWFTPPEYVEAAREVMGSIDIDPASNEVANHWIKAKQIFTGERDESGEVIPAQDGLLQEWHGNGYLNGPYGKTKNESNQGIWLRKAITEYRAGRLKQAVILMNFVPGYSWFSDAWEFPLCAVNHCISFWALAPDGKSVVRAGKAKASSVFLYIGPNVDKFTRVFSAFGEIIIPEAPGIKRRVS